MNAKYNLLISTAISTITIATVAALGSLSPSQASNITLTETNMSSTQVPTQVSQSPLETLLEEPSEQLRADIGKATYMLNEPAVQFDYDPNLFVLSSSEAAQPDLQPLLRSSTSLLSKEDYLEVENAGSELGDFPEKLKLSVYSNPDGIPALDWITGRPGESLGVEIEGITGRVPNTAVAGQDAWTFSYRSLFEYEGIIFQASNGQMVVVTAYKPPAQYVTPEVDKAYSAALSTMIESMELTTPVSE